MDEQQICGSVREACPAPGGASIPVRREVAVCPALREGALATVARQKAAKSSSNQFFFIELSAGSARLTQALRANGFHCVAIDIANGPHHDLMCRRARRRIHRLLRSGRCLGALAGLPCNGFSITRKFDGKGPPPLRTMLDVVGRPGLSAKDRAKVLLGNTLFAISIDIFEICREFRIPFRR